VHFTVGGRVISLCSDKADVVRHRHGDSTAAGTYGGHDVSYGAQFGFRVVDVVVDGRVVVNVVTTGR